MRVISRVYNNNVVSVIDANGNDVILVGSGVGYLAKKGAPVNEARIEREFHLTGLVKDGAFRVLLEIPTSVLGAVVELTTGIRERFKYSFTAAAEVALADHIAQAVGRENSGLHLANPMLWETRANYPQEFALAEQALDIVESRLGTRLPPDEAGFIALHFVNAGIFSESRRALSQSAAIRDILEIVRADLGITLAGDAPPARRFLVHLKFVIERVTTGRTHLGPLDPVFSSLGEKNPHAHGCAIRIRGYLERQFSTDLTEEETFYLMLHLIRVSEALAPDPGAGGEGAAP